MPLICPSNICASIALINFVHISILEWILDFGGCVRGEGGMINGWEADKRMDDSESLNPLIR
jgi:hypothetical protein